MHVKKNSPRTKQKKLYEITALAYSKDGRLLSVGKNSYTKTHPLQARLAAKVGRPKAIYIHAELDALIKAREDVHKLVVLRYDSKGNPMMAKPCNICESAIRMFGVKNVEHT